MTGKKEVQDLLQELARAIYSTIDDDLARGNLKRDYLRHFRWKVTKFEEGDDGTINMSREGEEFSKPVWHRATWIVMKKISKLNIYEDILMAISKGYGLEQAQSSRYLETLTTTLAWNTLQGKIKTPTDSDIYIIAFLKDLSEEEQEYKAEVQLRALVLQPASIQLNDNAKLRKPTRKDFEREVLMTFPSVGTFPLQDPTAFLHVRVYATKGATALQNEIDRAVALLRLFRVGAVQDIQHSSDTDSIIHMAGGTLTTGRLLGGDKYLITKEDVKPLKTFWANMKEVELPSSVYPSTQKEPDELSIAYDRYNDSLEGGIVEKRISSAVMGLEALFLTEIDELPYRLSMRVGKLLSLIGNEYRPSEVRDKIKDAYKIRNKYVHGAILKPADRQKLEEKYGNLQEFCKAIIDYLRASIVALLKRPSKNSLIQIIDDSFLNSEKEEEVRKLLFIPYEKEVA